MIGEFTLVLIDYEHSFVCYINNYLIILFVDYHLPF